MILGVAFCPHPPLLVPAVAGTGASEVADLLAACDSAVTTLTALSELVIVIGAGPVSASYPAGPPSTLAGYAPHPGTAGRPPGLPAPGPADPAASQDNPLPLSLEIGQWLLRRASARPARLIAVSTGGASDAAGVDQTDDVVLLVMGDGSARRSLKAPGYLDGRADSFDAQIGAALAQVDPGTLADLDPALGSDLLAAGVPAWRTVGRLLSDRPQPDWIGKILYEDDPFGVSYRVATWTPA